MWNVLHSATRLFSMHRASTSMIRPSWRLRMWLSSMLRRWAFSWYTFLSARTSCSSSTAAFKLCSSSEFCKHTTNAIGVCVHGATQILRRLRLFRIYNRHPHTHTHATMTCLCCKIIKLLLYLSYLLQKIENKERLERTNNSLQLLWVCCAFL